ncbi:MAG TPA: DinB family protein [Longimicrobiales bacterium]
MSASVLKYQFGMNARLFELTLAGITDEEAVTQPSGGGNCVNWIVGHIVASRESVLSHLGEESVWPAELVRRYERGSAPIRSAAEAPASLSAMREVFALAQERILRGLDGISAEALDEAVGDSTRGHKLAFLQFHEAYHVGQLGMLRRFLGKEGAIR